MSNASELGASQRVYQKPTFVKAATLAQVTGVTVPPVPASPLASG
jgi:hypothetical protein